MFGKLSWSAIPFGVPLAMGASLFMIVGILALLAWAVFHSFAMHSPGPPATPATVRELGTVLMAEYVLPLEVIGLMLTAALIGAVVVAMKEKQDTQ